MGLIERLQALKIVVDLTLFVKDYDCRQYS
jgi:hypothetical protein